MRLRILAILTALAAGVAAAVIVKRQLSPVATDPGPAGASCCAGKEDTNGLTPLFEVPAFSLTERNGRPLTRDDLLGKIWIADFVYTTCPGPCPLMTQRMASLVKDLPAGEDLRFVSFSVDPERDTPGVLQKYADRFKAGDHWFFLTGDREEIYRISTRGFRLALNTDSAPSATHPIVHSTRFVLVDRAGKIVGYYDGFDAQALAHLRKDVLSLLENKPTATAPAATDKTS